MTSQHRAIRIVLALFIGLHSFNLFIESFKVCKSRVTFPNSTMYHMPVARTQSQLTLGLSGPSGQAILKSDGGMLFLMPKPGIHSFWMKDTLTPLDIIWINNSTVVEITSLDKQIGSHIPQHTPSHIATAVLELNSGAAQKNQITVGSTISWTPCPN